MKLIPNNSTSYAFFSKLVDASRHWDAMELIFGLVLVHTYVENIKIQIFDISTFLLPIEVDFPERTENQASGIFGLGRDSHVYKGNYAKHH